MPNPARSLPDPVTHTLSAAAAPAGASYLPGLTGLRAAAVSAVIFHHLGQNWDWVAHRFWRTFAYNASLGVEAFFVLSGFLITRLLLAEEQRTGHVSLRRFYQRRALRILPPAFLYLATVALLVAAGKLAVDSADFLRCLAFVRNWFHGSWQTDHFWSLAIEEQFYLVWPLLFLLLGKSRRFAATVMLLTAAILWYHGYHFAVPGWPNPKRTDLCVEPLLWGCTLALCLAQTDKRTALDRWIHPAGFWLGVAFIVGSLCSPSSPIPFLRSVVGRLDYVAVTYSIAFLALRPQSREARVLEWAPIRWLGLISYSVYLWQALFIPRDEPTLGWTQSLPFNLLFVLGAATASYLLVERPLQSWRRRLG